MKQEQNRSNELSMGRCPLFLTAIYRDLIQTDSKVRPTRLPDVRFELYSETRLESIALTRCNPASPAQPAIVSLCDQLVRHSLSTATFLSFAGQILAERTCSKVQTLNICQKDKANSALYADGYSLEKTSLHGKDANCIFRLIN